MAGVSNEMDHGIRERVKSQQVLDGRDKVLNKNHNDHGENHTHDRIINNKTPTSAFDYCVRIIHTVTSVLIQTSKDLGSLAQVVTPYIFKPLELFDRIGINMSIFGIEPKFQPARDIPDLSQKVILVTGGNTGIGKETISQLAAHNPKKIYLCARTETKGHEAVASINSLVPSATVRFLHMDMTSFRSIKAAVEKFLSENDRLDLLYLNAGIMAVPEGNTEAGHEIQLGTNHIGHFLLTKLLLPILESTAKEHNSDVRILSVSSEAWQMAPSIDVILSPEKLRRQGTWRRYGATKAANIAFAAGLARRYPQITTVSLHPGVIKTDLYAPNKKSNFIIRWLLLVGEFGFRGVAYGALNQLWLGAGAAKTELVNGAYYTPVGKLRKNKWSADPVIAEKLWTWTEAELARSGY